MIGLRGLLNASENTILRIRLTDHIGMDSSEKYNVRIKGTKEESETEEIDLERDIQMIRVLDPTRSPNYGQVITLKNIKLPAEPLMWPFLIFEAIQDGQVISSAMSPIFPFSFLSKKLIKFTMTNLMKGQTEEGKDSKGIAPNPSITGSVTAGIQPQQNPVKTYMEVMK